MHLVTFNTTGHRHIGVLDTARQEVVDLSVAAPELPRTMLGLIESGASTLRAVRIAADSGKGRLALNQVEILAPIPQPRRDIFCVGKNFLEHVQEVRNSAPFLGKTDVDTPEVPIIFTKAAHAVTGPDKAIPAAADPTATVDYEGELAVIIGTGGKGIRRDRAMEHIFGYTIINDVTSRKLQREHKQWFLGKSIDGFCPMGPALVTRDAMPAVHSLRIRTTVNGELRQDAPVTDMIFDIPMLIETISRTMTLLPGDILSTGTPAGVGMGFTPPKWLQPGDRVAISIEPIGTLSNPVG